MLLHNFKCAVKYRLNINFFAIRVSIRIHCFQFFNGLQKVILNCAGKLSDEVKQRFIAVMIDLFQRLFESLGVTLSNFAVNKPNLIWPKTGHTTEIMQKCQSTRSLIVKIHIITHKKSNTREISILKTHLKGGLLIFVLHVTIYA